MPSGILLGNTGSAPDWLLSGMRYTSDRFFAYYRAHDWAAIAELLTDGSVIENRTPVVSSGLWEGRDVSRRYTEGAV